MTKKKRKRNKISTKKIKKKNIKPKKIENLYEEEEKKKNSFFKNNYITNVIFVTVSLFLIEILFKAISKYEIFNFSSLRILFSSIIFSMIIVFFSMLTKRKWLKNTIIILFIFIYSFYSWLQLGFYNFLGVYMSFNTTSQIGAVIDYINDYLLSFKLIYYCIFFPFIFFIIYTILMRKKEYNKIKIEFSNTFISILILIFSCTTYYLTLSLPSMQNKLQTKSNIKLFKNPDVPTIAVNQFGTFSYGLTDLKSFVFPKETNDYELLSSTSKELYEKPNREVLPVLNDLAENETNSKYINLNKFFASRNIPDFNDYTGMFKNKNVVVIMIESGSDALINEEDFPNFYKMYNEGWAWNNHYSPRNSCATGNNEFSALTSLYSIYNTCTMNTYEDNSYYEAIFGIFKNAGYITRSMHDYDDTYYNRSIAHINMGSSEYYSHKELDIDKGNYYGDWPSDDEFFEKAFDIILNEKTNKPWFTWLTTVTGHQPYTSSSKYGDLYKNYFTDKGYSNTASRYLSKLKVFDDALGTMIDKLKESNVLDDTVIVMFADHYPYGLNYDTYKELVSHSLNGNEKERTPFVIYNSEMESKKFDEYTSYINLLPTLANLMGIDYDPRLYIGSDLFSNDYNSLVVFTDGSWKNELAYYNAATGRIEYYTELEYTIEEIQSINENINTNISMSNNAIRNNYFDYLKNKIDEYILENSKTTNEITL